MRWVLCILRMKKFGKKTMPKISTVENPFLYEKIANFIITMIQQGTLQPKDKLPSIRTLSKQMGVSTVTVIQAYRFLEQTGWVEAAERSGFRALPVKKPELKLPQKTQPSMLSKKIS